MADEWRDAIGLLPPGEAAELEALMTVREARRPRRAARVAPTASAKRGKRATNPDLDAPPAPAATPDNRVWYVSSDPTDKLKDFTDRSGLGDPGPKCWVDGV